MRQKLRAKNKLNANLRGWLSTLEANQEEFEKALEAFIKDNPFVSVTSKLPTMQLSSLQKKSGDKKRHTSDAIEALSLYEKSLYEVLEEQISPPLFPTPKSQEVAFMIIDYISEDGFFEGSAQEIAESCGVSEGEVEKIRARFAHLEPAGVGAKDQVESMIFQILSLGLERDLADLCLAITKDLENHKALSQNPRYYEAMRTISHLSTRPALVYSPSDIQKIPDIFVELDEDGLLQVRINDSYYPNIIIYNAALQATDPELKAKVREAKDFADALDMRKATIGKIAAVIFEQQFDFFRGGALKPLTLKIIADELGYNQSTISRAIKNKYLQCPRGVFALGCFFSAAVGSEETSNAEIKEFLKRQIVGEDRKNPLSDIKLQALVEEEFDIKIVRRTITKYRKQLSISSSSERKKEYEIGM